MLHYKGAGGTLVEQHAREDEKDLNGELTLVYDMQQPGPAPLMRIDYFNLETMVRLECQWPTQS